MSSKGNKESAGVTHDQKLEKDIRATFELFDKNNDKTLSAAELGKSLRSLGFRLTYKEVQLAVKQIDKNGNGTIEYKEFRDYVMVQIKKDGNDKERRIRQVFALFDRDGNGFIDKNELRRAMHSLGEELTDSELDEMIQEADDNSDGRIDYEEFVQLLNNKLAD